MIACFLSNISAKYYKNSSMLSRVIAKNVGDVFLRHSVQHNITQFNHSSLLYMEAECYVSMFKAVSRNI